MADYYNIIKNNWDEFLKSDKFDEICESVAEKLGDPYDEKTFSFDIDYIVQYTYPDKDYTKSQFTDSKYHYTGTTQLSNITIKLNAFSIKHIITVEVPCDANHIDSILNDLSNDFMQALKINIKKISKIKPTFFQKLFKEEADYLVMTKVADVKLGSTTTSSTGPTAEELSKMPIEDSFDYEIMNSLEESFYTTGTIYIEDKYKYDHV